MELASPELIARRRFDRGTRAAAVLAATGLAYLLLAPDPWWLIRVLLGQTGDETFHSGSSDKLHHLLAYLTLTLLVLLSALSRGRRTVVLSLIAVGTHAAATEFLQRFVPPRTTDWLDLVANASGILLGVGIVDILQRTLGWIPDQTQSLRD